MKMTDVSIAESLSDVEDTEIETKVDAGALDGPSEKIDAGEEGADSMPGPPEPEKEEDAESSEEEFSIPPHILQKFTEQKQSNITRDQVDSASATVPPQEQSQDPVIAKVRRRGGAIGAAASSDRMGARGKVSATGAGPKRGRR